MRLAIADPPYLGRAVRWYGGGRGGSGHVLAEARQMTVDQVTS